MKNLQNILILVIVLLTSCEKWDLNRKPDVETLVVTGISQTGAITGGDIREYGGTAIQEKGICLSRLPNPDINDSVFKAGSGDGKFYKAVTNLYYGSTYFVRAFALTSFGYTYGNEVSFTTLNGGAKPVINTLLVTEISENSAKVKGEVVYGGNSSVLKRGFCFGTTPMPTIHDDTLLCGGGTGLFEGGLVHLTVDTKYYVRAYAINSTDTVYGNQLSFITLSGTGSLPNLSTAALTGITQTTALSGGNILYSGSSNVTNRGVCWSTTPNPKITDFISIDGSGSGSYVSILYDLQPNTQYFVRSYATNSTGTAYGNQLSFTTLGPVTLPQVSTISVGSITQFTASAEGYVLSAGGGVVSARGCCWSTVSGPTLGDSFTVDGSGTGSFNSQLTGLVPNTTYYLRTYATNAAGTSYGSEISFTTLQSTALTIGQTYEGGIIFYLDFTGEHGLIAAPSDQGSGIIWGCYGMNIPGASGTGIGSGLTNTNMIGSGCSEENIAAKICLGLQLSGYSDWYLPSKEELNLLFLQKTVVGNFQDSYYWSSSENSANEAWEQNFSSGLQLAYWKSDPISVRAIRSF